MQLIKGQHFIGKFNEFLASNDNFWQINWEEKDNIRAIEFNGNLIINFLVGNWTYLSHEDEFWKDIYLSFVK